MEDEIKEELAKTLQTIVERFSGDVRAAVQTIIVDINTVLASVITDPQNEQHQKNLKILYGNLTARAAITERETRELIASSIQRVLTKTATILILAI